MLRQIRSRERKRKRRRGEGGPMVVGERKEGRKEGKEKK